MWSSKLSKGLAICRAKEVPSFPAGLKCRSQVTGHRSGYRSQATGQVTGQITGHRSDHRSHKNNRTLDKTVLD